MDLHRVRRLTETLVASQLRSGRTSSNPKAWAGRSWLIALLDVALFTVGVALASAVLRPIGLSGGELAQVTATTAPLLPLVAVGAVLIAGVLFELTTTARFSGSDAANWLPVTPSEYVASSASAIAYTYSPAVALFLGALLPVAVAGGALGTYLLAAVLSAVGLFEGGVLVEMVRAATQRTGAPATGRRGQIAILLRAMLLVVLILAFDLAFNPVLLLPLVEQFSAHELVTAAVPVFWSTEALSLWSRGEVALGLGFTAGQCGFVALLVFLAGRLRARYWTPMPTEARLSVPFASRGHPLWRALGLSAAEAALASKDLRGFVRRREMLPTLVVPVVLIVLLLAEGSSIGLFGSVLWAGWVAGFFSLLLASTSIGQERRSLQSLFAYPISSRTVLRAKAASVLFPALVGAEAMTATVGGLFRFPPLELLALALLLAVGSVVLAFWGFAFAARYSDFQERPRPQYLRPGAMLAALGSGMVVLFGFLVPGILAILAVGSPAPGLLALAFAIALGIGGFAVYWARTGFDRLFRELPF